MPHYVMLVSWTDQGIRSAKDSPKRRADFRRKVETAGGKWVGVYYTFGQYDLVGIFEFPNDETALHLALSLGSLGNVRTTTLKAFTEAEFDRVAQKLQ